MTSAVTQNKIATIEPKGYVSAANATQLEQQLQRFVASKEHSVVLVNMEGVEFMDSAGLMVLVNALHQSKGVGLRFMLCSLNQSVRMIFEITQLDRVFEIFDSRDLAEAII